MSDKKEETKELTFEEIDQWVQQKYCLFCAARQRSVDINKLEEAYGKKIEDVFNNLITIQPTIVDSPDTLNKLFQSLNTIISAGGRVIMIIGT